MAINVSRMTPVVVAVVVMIGSSTVVDGELIYVGGGKETWRPNVNFSAWSAHQRFHLGDWLYFGFDERLYSVLEVNKTSYESCNEASFIKNVTRGGRDVYELTQVKTYYFISGGGYCFGGMKVAINVENTARAPAPSQAKSASTSKFHGQVTIAPMLIIIIRTLAWAFI